jgi:hypothetical protein
VAEVGGHCGLASDSCGWEELLAPGFDDLEEAGASLVAGPGWAREWTAHWKYDDGPAACPVRDLAAMPLQGARPVRRFSWSTSQRHRRGLQYMVSTGRHHGFESHAEQELLLALDFAGDLVDVLSQPFRLVFTAAGGRGPHTPDFLAVTRDGVWLIDVRPGARIGKEDKIRFAAAAAEASLSCGWRYAVADGWLPNVQVTLDTLSAQRRPLTDPLHLQPTLLAAAEGGPVRFGELVEHGGIPAAARAQALHLIWERRLGIDLAVPLGDASLVHAGTSRR